MVFQVINEILNIPFLKYFAIILTIFLLMYLKSIYDSKLREEDRKLMKKNDKTRIGKRFYINRKENSDIEMNLYIRSESNNYLPLLINIHGGAFIAGDADTLDTQSDRISKQFN